MSDSLLHFAGEMVICLAIVVHLLAGEKIKVSTHFAMTYCWLLIMTFLQLAIIL